LYNAIIIGAGQKGCLSDDPGDTKYTSYAHAIEDNPDIQIIDIIDTDSDQIIKAKAKWTIIDDQKQCDIVIITTPDILHHISLYQALLYKPQLVICEKPICGEPHYYGVEELYSNAKIPILMDYTRRFIPQWQSISTLIAAGEYGSFAGGHLYFNGGREHTASHFVDLCRFFGLTNTEITKKIDFVEVNVNYKWVWDWALIYELGAVNEVNYGINQNYMRTYDLHLQYVIQHAIDYLDKKIDRLICTGRDGFEALELLKQCEIRSMTL